MKSITKIIAICLFCAFACGVVSAAETTVDNTSDHTLTIVLIDDIGISNDVYYWGVVLNGDEYFERIPFEFGKRVGEHSRKEMKIVIPDDYFIFPDDKKPNVVLSIETNRYCGFGYHKHKIDCIGVDISSLVKRPNGQISKKIVIEMKNEYKIAKFDEIKIYGKDDYPKPKPLCKLHDAKRCFKTAKRLFKLPATKNEKTEYHNWLWYKPHF